MPTDDELRNISERTDWSQQERTDYNKLQWLSRRLIDLILKFPRVINWVRQRSAAEPVTRIGRARQRAQKEARERSKRGADRK